MGRRSNVVVRLEARLTMVATSIRLRERCAARDARLHQLGFADYRAYLRSPQWQSVKARYRASDLPQGCLLCDTDERLQFHHLTYERVGEELLDDVAPLCSTCHGIVHVLERRGEIGLDFDGLANPQRALRYRVEQAQRYEDVFAESDYERWLQSLEVQKRSVLKRLKEVTRTLRDPGPLLESLAATVEEVKRLDAEGAYDHLDPRDFYGPALGRRG